jgi:Aspartyl protease
MRRRNHLTAVILAFLMTGAAYAGTSDAIDGVQAAALDQPRIYLNLRRTAEGRVLETSEKTSAIEAFLDTGASGVVLSSGTVENLGVKSSKTTDGKPISFEDIGVGGSEQFEITEPLFLALSPYPQGGDEDDATFSKPAGPVRAEIRQEQGILAMLAPGLDIAGMPMIAGKVIVMDPTPLAKLDLMRTSVVAPKDTSIPKTKWHVPLTMVAFDRFTKTTPKGAQGPTQKGSPMIGPDPFAPNGRTRGIVISRNGKQVTGTFLLDTGAATSMISIKLAKQLGIEVAEDGTPQGLGKEKTFSLAVGGLGGQKNGTGLYFDRLELPTREGKPIVYEHAPLLISDITVTDAAGKTFTLDGVFGMNYLVASAQITGGLLPDIGETSDGPYKWVVVDLARNELGLDPR